MLHRREISNFHQQTHTGTQVENVKQFQNMQNKRIMRIIEKKKNEQKNLIDYSIFLSNACTDQKCYGFTVFFLSFSLFCWLFAEANGYE